MKAPRFFVWPSVLVTVLMTTISRRRSFRSPVKMKGSGSTHHYRKGLYGIEGRTESELDSICDRLRDEYHLTIDVGPLTAVLLETVQRQAEGEGKYIRQTGGSGNYGHCRLRVEPNDRGKGYEFVNDIKNGSILGEYAGSIEEGVQNAMKLGMVAGFPFVDVKVTLHDGSYHETDSNAMAFMFAGSIAFKEAARRAAPVVLEPVMAIEMDVPEQLSATAANEIHANRGRLVSCVTIDGLCEMRAIVPLSELLVPDSAIAHCPREFVGYEPDRG